MRGLGLPVWISAPDRKILFLNRRAERLLAVRAREVPGSPCYEVIAACEESGCPFCAPHCPLLRAAEERREFEPLRLQVVGRRPLPKRVGLLAIPVWLGRDRKPFLVHCAFESGGAEHLEHYLRKVASRTLPLAKRSICRSLLSVREREVLSRLADDEDMHVIASKLHRSRVTVRNHVQHILRKLGVHSIPEAVALYLIEESRVERGPQAAAE